MLLRMLSTRSSKRVGLDSKQDAELRELVARDIKFEKAMRKKVQEESARGGEWVGITVYERAIRFVGRSGNLVLYVSESAQIMTRTSGPRE